jgi:hypothetical protein
MIQLVALGTVAFWHSDEGWGAITAPNRATNVHHVGWGMNGLA